MRRGSASSYPLGVVARVALGVDEVEEGVELDGSFEDDDDVEFVVAGASAGAAVEERLVPGVAVRLGLERVDVGDEGLRRRSRGAGRRVSLREIVIARKHLVQGVARDGEFKGSGGPRVDDRRVRTRRGPPREPDARVLASEVAQALPIRRRTGLADLGDDVSRPR